MSLSLPQADRPREKLRRYGPSRLTVTELLALLLGTGTRTLDVLALAHKLVSQFGGQGLMQQDIESLVKISGLGLTKASQLVAAFELGRRLLIPLDTTTLFNPKDIWLQLKTIRQHKKEHCIVFYLDSRRQEIGREVISVGTVNASLVHPREVFEPAITNLASGLILAHNHPFGSLEPSTDDLQLTQRLAEAGQLLGIPLLDHIIVTHQGWLSFKEQGLLTLAFSQEHGTITLKGSI